MRVPHSGVDPQAGVLVETGVVTGRDLLATLERVEERLLREPLGRRPLRLIAIDSIANVFRCALRAVAQRVLQYGQAGSVRYTPEKG